MTCSDIRKALSDFGTCVETEDGARIHTHCLYPSFDPVKIFVVGFGEGFIVHDGAGAFRSAWDHATDDWIIRRAMTRQANKYRVAVDENALSVTIPSAEWLRSAILSVANASASAAHAAIEHVVVSNENKLKERIFSTLSGLVRQRLISRDFEVTGRSGKVHHFDFGVRNDGEGHILINAVWPHHVSVAAKYVAFADTKMNDMHVGRLAVYERELEAKDVSLMQQVADLVPFNSLSVGIQRTFGNPGQY